MAKSNIINIILGPYGFCFGVDNAFKGAIERLKNGEKLITDGEIVHNKSVVSRLEKLGLRYLNEQNNTNESNKNFDNSFVVRAHGLPPKKIAELSKEYKIIDLTCPIVNNLFKLAKKLSEDGYCVIVFGEKEHAEMVALVGHVENAIVTLEPIQVKQECEKIVLISQTTSSEEDFYKFVDEIKRRNPDKEIKILNTICRVTIERENAVKMLGKICDLIIVIGGKNSSNTKKLFSIASKHTKAIHIENLEEFKYSFKEFIFKDKINKENKSSNMNIGIISGTSTHREDVDAICNYLLEKHGGREFTMADLSNLKDLNNTEELSGENNFEESFEKLLLEHENMNQVGRGKIVEGLITEVTSTSLTVDLGGKVTGVVPIEELVKEVNEYKTGDKIKVRVEKIDEENGTAILSEKKPMFKQVLDELGQAYKSGKAVNGKIVDRTKGGYKVILENVIEAFLPGSESNMRPEDEFSKVKSQFIIISYELRGKKTNIVVSQKRLSQKLVEEFFNHKKPGDVIEGIIENITEKGAIIKISEMISGFLPNSEVSYDSSTKAIDILTQGKSMKFIIKEIQPANKRIILSLKALLPDPWENVPKKYHIGQVLTGIVTSVKPFGFFVKFDDGIEGFVPIEEVFWGRKGNINEIVSVGDGAKVQIIEINQEKKQIKLSYKSVVGDPWENIAKKMPKDSLGEGKVIKVLPNGIIIEVEPQVTAFCNISELSWNFVDNIEDVVREGDRVKFRVLSIDTENKKIRVSVRKAQENPWELFAKNHKEGDTVKAKVIKNLEKGYIGICENIEVYIPKTQINENLNLGTQIDGKIIKIEQFKDIYKIIISPKALENEQMMEEAKEFSDTDSFSKVSMEVKFNNETETKSSGESVE